MIDVDFHSHILPCIDDGAVDAETSQRMLVMLKEQGISTVAATSHYDSKTESVSEFLKRRKESFDILQKTCDMAEMPRIVQGAEIYCTEGISKIDLAPLCYGETDLLLFELPRLPYGDWIMSELEVIAYKQKLVPVIAHIDRYMDWYSDKEIEELLSFQDAIFQVNNRAFTKKKTCKKVVEIIERGYPVIMGSDAHDIDMRRPNFDDLNRILRKFSYRRSVTPMLEETLKRIVI